MKKIIYILSLFTISLASSCVVEDSYDSNHRTAQGKLVFDQTKGMFNNVINLAETAGRVSLYLETPEEEKQAVWDFYLHEMTLKDTQPNSISMSIENTTITFYHNGKNLSQDGAEWDIARTIKSPYSDDVEELKRGSFKITTSLNNTWTINLLTDSKTNNPLWLHNGSLKMKVTKAIAKATHLYIYNIYEGQGSELHTYSNYKIVEPVQYTSSIEQDFGMASAKLELEAGKDLIEAQMTNYRSVSITMQGITEEYYDYWYSY